MEIKATTKYVRMSPTKARDLAQSLKGLSAGKALQVVELNKRKAAVQLGKTLRSAIANAENNADASADSLFVASAIVENGPTIPRYWPRSRGSASPIRKKTAHIRVVLSDQKPVAKKRKPRNAVKKTVKK